MLRYLTIALALIANPLVADAPNCGLYAYSAKIARIIDGDTVVANIDLGFSVWIYDEHLRLLGINAPERGEPGYQEAKDALDQRISGKDVYICTVKAKTGTKEETGKYGRYLATIYHDGENLNAWLLEAKLAVPYN